VLRRMVLRVERASRKEVARTGEAEDEDKTGASSKKAIQSPTQKHIQHEWHNY